MPAGHPTLTRCIAGHDRGAARPAEAEGRAAHEDSQEKATASWASKEDKTVISQRATTSHGGGTRGRGGSWWSDTWVVIPALWPGTSFAFPFRRQILLMYPLRVMSAKQGHTAHTRCPAWHKTSVQQRGLCPVPPGRQSLRHCAPLLAPLVKVPGR